jgi:thiamine-phosphate pyrophosphorylase
VSLDLSLYLVTDTAIAAAAGHSVLSVVREAVAGGVTVVQLREKHATAREFLELTRAVAEAVPESVTVIVNDRVDVFLAARKLGARVGGVHLGQSDLPPTVAREMIGPDAVLGLSASTRAQLHDAQNDPGAIDYVGIGALHATTTKADAPRPLGIGAFAALAQAIRGMDLSVAYAVWGGAGLVITAIIGVLVFGQRIAPGGWAGIGLVVVGVTALKLL